MLHLIFAVNLWVRLDFLIHDNQVFFESLGQEEIFPSPCQGPRDWTAVGECWLHGDSAIMLSNFTWFQEILKQLRKIGQPEELSDCPNISVKIKKDCFISHVQRGRWIYKALSFPNLLVNMPLFPGSAQFVHFPVHLESKAYWNLQQMGCLWLWRMPANHILNTSGSNRWRRHEWGSLGCCVKGHDVKQPNAAF